MTNPRDDGEARREGLTPIEEVRKSLAMADAGYAWELESEYAEALLSAYDDLSRQLAEARGVIERYGKALDEIGQMGPHTAAWSAQTVARVARNPSRSRTTEGK